jgi:hypothetical protein
VERGLGLGLRARRLAGRRRGRCVCVCGVCPRPFFDLGKALLEALGDKVEFPMGRLRVARDNGVEHCYKTLSVDFDSQVFLLDYAAYFA